MTAISKDDVNKGTHDKAVGEDMKAERRSGSLENTVKSPPVAPQLAIPHNNTLSKGDNDDAKSNKRRDKGDAVTTTASAWLKKPIYTTIGFAVFAGIVVGYWLFAVIAITLLVYFCFIRKASEDDSSEDEEDGQDSQRKEKRLKKYGKSNKGSKINKGKDMKSDSESDEGGEDDKEKPVVKKKKKKNKKTKDSD
uniref:Transmembrane protein n=1 Tax=Ascaris lumbricoides TaxID=6252 RepID=A0A0M3HX38_ASCLU